MKKEILLSGIGGQGIMNLGEILCAAAMKAGYNATFSPVYQGAKRGGLTMCNVIISTEVECQIVSEADVMLCMEERSLMEYQHLAGENGVLILSTLVGIEPDCPCKNVKKIPFIELATEMGNGKVANMIVLGYLGKHLDFIPYENFEEEIRITFAKKAKLIPLNLEALKKGYELA